MGRQRAFLTEARTALLDYAGSDFRDDRRGVELSSLADVIRDADASRCVRATVQAKDAAARIEASVQALDALGAAIVALDEE